MPKKITHALRVIFCALSAFLIIFGIFLTCVLIAHDTTPAKNSLNQPPIFSSSSPSTVPSATSPSTTSPLAPPVSRPLSQNAPPTPTTPKFISLQSIIDNWVATTNRQVGLMLYDLDNDQVAASYQPNKVFNIASIYKLFFAYDGYRQIDLGIDDPTAVFSTTFDYRAGNHTLGECLDLMIRESYNGCADRMYSSRVRQSHVQQIIDNLKLTSTTAYGLYSSASDLTAFLSHLWQHTDLSDDSWLALSDSMLHQPPTKVNSTDAYDWRQGTPAGFSDSVQVYNKVGWAWNGKTWDVYADAAILDFPDLDRHYTLVVLTTNFPDYQPLTSLAALIESAITHNDIH